MEPARSFDISSLVRTFSGMSHIGEQRRPGWSEHPIHSAAVRDCAICPPTILEQVLQKRQRLLRQMAAPCQCRVIRRKRDYGVRFTTALTALLGLSVQLEAFTLTTACSCVNLRKQPMCMFVSWL